MKLKRKILGAIAASAILIPTLGMVVSCSCGGEEPGPGPGPTPPDPPQPVVEYDVNFVTEEYGVTIEGKAVVTVESGTTFGEINKPQASKVIHNERYKFMHWYRSGDPQKKKIEDKEKIESTWTICPLFETNPTPPEKIIVSFTSEDTTVQILEPTVVLEPGQTFGDIDVPDPIKTVVPGEEWEFKWWYRDKYSETSWMTDDTILLQDITVHPYFEKVEIQPAQTFNVTITDGGQEGVEITPAIGTFPVDENTTFNEFKTNIELYATKDFTGYPDTPVAYWSMDPVLPPSEDTPYRPKEIEDEYVIDHDITISPFFIDPNTQWKPKTIVLDDQSWDKNIILPEMTADEVETRSCLTNVSHFKLALNAYTEDDDNPVVLDEKEWVETWVTPNAATSDVLKNTKVLPDSSNPVEATVIGDKVAVNPLEISSLPEGGYYIEDDSNNKLVFDVHFRFYFDDAVQGSEIVFEGLSLQFTKPNLLPPIEIKYERKESGQEVESYGGEQEGVNGATIKSKEVKDKGAKGYFYTNRPLESNEHINVELLDPEDTSKKKDNIETTLSTEIGDDREYINLGLHFTRIQSLFEVHKAQFKIRFILTTEGSGLPPEELDISETFELVYNPSRDIFPYQIALQDQYVNNTNSKEIRIPVQIENEKFPYFEDTDYLVVENLEPHYGDPDKPTKITNPIYFTTPHEKENPGQKGGDYTIPLQGQGQGHDLTNFTVNFAYVSDQTKTTQYKIPLRFTFYEGNPKEDPDAPIINSFEREINFVNEPITAKTNFTMDEWAQKQTLGIVQTAYDKQTNEKVTTFGTAWILNYRKQQGLPYYYATSYDVQADFEKLTDTGRYRDYRFGIALYDLASQRNANDPTKYIIVDDDGINDNNDIVEYAPTDALHKDCVKFVNADEFAWKGSIIGKKAPNIAVFSLSPYDYDNWTPGSNDDIVEHYYNFGDIYRIWSQKGFNEGLILQEPFERGQVAAIYNTPSDFSSREFEYGYVGGYRHKEITINGKKTQVLYWSGYTMSTRDEEELFHMSALTFRGGCDDAWRNIHGCMHIAPAFAMFKGSYPINEYLDDAGRGAMFVVRRRPNSLGYSTYPMIAAINTNAGSNLNKAGHITPYCDCFIDGSDNVIEKYLYGL